MTHRLTPALLEIKRHTVTATGEFQGYASTWDGQPDSYGDVIRKGAFTQALDTHRTAGTTPAMLWSHDQSKPIGKWLDFTEDDHGLLATGRLTLATKQGAESLALLRDDAIALSVGFILAEGGANTKNSVRFITKVARLAEISLVAIPANTNARIIEVKRPGTVREFERVLRDVGFSSRDAKSITTYGFRDTLASGGRSPIDQLTEVVEKLQRTIEAGA